MKVISKFRIDEPDRIIGLDLCHHEGKFVIFKVTNEAIYEKLPYDGEGYIKKFVEARNRFLMDVAYMLDTAKVKNLEGRK